METIFEEASKAFELQEFAGNDLQLLFLYQSIILDKIAEKKNFFFISDIISPVSGRREGTFYQPSSDESFALGQRLQYLAEEAYSSRSKSFIHKHQDHTQLWVVN